MLCSLPDHMTQNTGYTACPMLLKGHKNKQHNLTGELKHTPAEDNSHASLSSTWWRVCKDCLNPTPFTFVCWCVLETQGLVIFWKFYIHLIKILPLWMLTCFPSLSPICLVFLLTMFPRKTHIFSNKSKVSYNTWAIYHQIFCWIGPGGWLKCWRH